MSPEALTELRDWHLPDPVSWWPPAPGWWLIAGAALVGGLGLALWLRRLRGRTSARRAAQRELERLRERLASDKDGRRYLAQLSQLLRRVALARFRREQVAGLSGQAWLDLLDATGGGGHFSGGSGRALIEDVYRRDGPGPSQETLNELHQLAARWIAVNGVKGS